MRDQACKKIREKIMERPIVVFMLLPDAALKNELEVIKATAGCDLTYIDTFAEAQKVRDRVHGNTRGITVLGRELARGYDYKLGKDGYVVVFGNDQKMSLSFAK